MKWLVEDVNCITLYDLNRIKGEMSGEELKEIDIKVQNIINTTLHDSVEQRLVAQEYLRLGMIAGRVEFIKYER